jgi:hypothetical protein
MLGMPFKSLGFHSFHVKHKDNTHGAEHLPTSCVLGYSHSFSTTIVQ